MQIVHDFGNSIDSKETSNPTAFLLTNRKNAFFSLSSENISLSRYNGLFFSENNVLNKCINSISAGKNSLKVLKLINYGSIIERQYDSGSEQFSMVEGKNILLYSSKDIDEISISVDMRSIFCFDEWNRNYTISEESNCVLVSYSQNSYSSYIAISYEGLKKENIEKWRKEEYRFDQKRNSNPYSLYVFDTLKIYLGKESRISFGFSLDKETAISNALYGLSNFEQLRKFRKPKISLKIKENSINCAYVSCINSLLSLRSETLSGKNKALGIFAGIPWFYELWTRDALISSGAFVKEKRNHIKKMLLLILDEIKEDGHLPNKLPSYGSNADSIGWLAKRLSEANLSASEIKKIIPKLAESAEDMIKYSTKGNLAFNYEKETWMDSIYRPGARIEIQALRLFIYHFLYESTSDKRYLELEKSMKAEVLEKFWNAPVLADGYHDFKADTTIRPNIFIAYYIYPSLLTKKQWISCFDNALEKLGLDWGGLSTIAKDNHFFTPEHTGENSYSYHSGDSWYWINNLAALCLARIDGKRYDSYIRKILSASTDDILYQGFIGHHSEISSASNQEAFGCWAQAWSAAMYIELVHELDKNSKV